MGVAALVCAAYWAGHHSRTSDVVNASHRLIEETLRAGGTVSFPGFGTFATSKRKAGKVRHIVTGKTVEYPARKVAVFKVGEYLKRAVAGKRRR